MIKLYQDDSSGRQLWILYIKRKDKSEAVYSAEHRLTILIQWFQWTFYKKTGILLTRFRAKKDILKLFRKFKIC